MEWELGYKGRYFDPFNTNSIANQIQDVYEINPDFGQLIIINFKFFFLPRCYYPFFNVNEVFTCRPSPFKG